MVIARASPGAKLLYSTTTLLRQSCPRRGSLMANTSSRNLATNTPDFQNKPPRSAPRERPSRPSPPQHQNASKNAPKQQQPPKKAVARMVIPTAAKRFINENGRLMTTPDNWAFLQEFDIEYDNRKASTLNLGPEHARIISNFSLKVLYSTKHIMHPHDLQYLDPRDHPLADSIKAKYRKKVKEEPLWVIMLDQNDQPGLVRSIGHRRLTAAFWTAMKDLGYSRFPAPEETSRVTGTIIVKIRDAAAAANFPAYRFGEAVAKSVEREWKASQERAKNSSSQKIQW